MRISDWSSDVCSSDLGIFADQAATARDQHAGAVEAIDIALDERARETRARRIERGLENRGDERALRHGGRPVRHRSRPAAHRGRAERRQGPGFAGWRGARSEEDTSELQAPMRHSYGLFCLKKNN